MTGGGVKVDKGIPIPPLRRGVVQTAWKRLEVGDSFFAPVQPSGYGGTQRKLQSLLVTQAMHYCREYGWEFTTRQVIENDVPGVRVWRTK